MTLLSYAVESDLDEERRGRGPSRDVTPWEPEPWPAVEDVACPPLDAEEVTAEPTEAQNETPVTRWLRTRARRIERSERR